MESHTADILDFAKTLNPKAVVIGHSFAGLFVQYLSLEERRDHFCGFAALSSTPPSGNGAMIRRFIQRDFSKAIKVSWVLLRRTFKKDPALAQFLFFSEDIPRNALHKYHTELANCSPAPIVDVGKLSASLPLPPPKDFSYPAFVLGGDSDNLVDEMGVRETGEWYGVEPVVLKDMAHDLMLDTRWEEAASALYEWLEATF